MKKDNRYLFRDFTKEDLKLFLSHASIYRSGYNRETPDHKWVHIDSYLTDDVLINSILKQRKERSNIAFSSCYMSNFFILDLDCHKFYGKNYFADKKQYIEKQYDYLTSIFGSASLICSTPRGLHLYYFLKEKISVDTLHEYVADKLYNSEKSIELQSKFSEMELTLKNQSYYNTMLTGHESGTKFFFNFEPNSIDIKPGVESYVRTFSKSKLLHANLSIYNKKTKFSYIISKAPVYSIGELFEEQLNKNIKKKNIVFKEHKDYSVITIGHTNEAMNYLIPLWKSNGYSDEECTDMFISRLESSYSGPCKSFNHVLKRVICYTGFTSNKITATSSSLYEHIYRIHKQAIDSAIAISNGQIANAHNRLIRANNIKKIMCTIYSIQDKVYAIKCDKRIFYKQCSENPFYRLETSKGRIPISSSVLKAQVTNYEPVFNFLKSINFITSNKSTYSTINKSCIYYFINNNFYQRVYKIFNKLYKKFNTKYDSNNRYVSLRFPQSLRISSNMFVPYFINKDVNLRSSA